MGPKPALEAIILTPRAQRECLVSPELPCGRRPHPQLKVLQRSGMGPKPALEAIILTPRAQRECLVSPELPCGRRSHPA